MAATLKMCIMIHIEDHNWIDTEDGTPENIGLLSTVIGPALDAQDRARGAKLSLQVGRDYFDRAPAPPKEYAPPTSLSWLLNNGGNFWCQVHCTTGAHLESSRPERADLAKARVEANAGGPSHRTFSGVAGLRMRAEASGGSSTDADVQSSAPGWRVRRRRERPGTMAT